ncbi:GlsB/YeaQ/YmgE family stress response membrane protein [Peloplasma aerotolerans]|uniref:GlsB/YeaQ/YmgE family stress response membrane protein n=1 Tax=Peloplasma aerotolerans TaxID=3044389 RepID=A0AAW6UBC9_9MOLU|nr:GlsB/YeaQ/YmgE family stress response membrane protein [Mariniplasma sp. M4Ah]MDI6452979.1 GlsB/YeaQ/YmgE family stress response membrane protein [Mariniplasma sp. M4Ah]
MYIILWLIFGALVGWIASILMNKNRSMGLLANIIIGILGSILGMWLLGIFGLGQPNTFSFMGFVVSVGGAALLIAIITSLRRR